MPFSILIATDIVATALFFSSAIWYDFIEFYFGFPFNRQTAFGVAVLAFAASGAYRFFRARTAIVGDHRLQFAVLLYFSLCTVGHFIAGEESRNLTFLVAPLVAFAMISIDRRIVVSFLTLTVAVSLLFEAIEFLTCRYFYVFDNGVFKLDELLYSGSTHSFRAKGLFTSPLSGNYIALIAILLSGLSIPIIAMSSLGGIMALSKGAIASNAALLILRVFRPGRLIRSAVVGIFFAIALLGAAQLARSFVCIWPVSSLEFGRNYKREAEVSSPIVQQTNSKSLIAEQATTPTAEKTSPNNLHQATPSLAGPSQEKSATTQQAAPAVAPPSKEEYDVPRDEGQRKLVERIKTGQFSVAEFLGTTFDPSASTTSYRFFVWKQNLIFFLNFDFVHMLFGWPHFAYQIDIQGTESSVINELQDYGIIGFTVAMILKVFAARRLWMVSRIMTIAAIGYYVLAALQPIFTTLGTCVLFWLFVVVATTDPERLKPREFPFLELLDFRHFWRRGLTSLGFRPTEVRTTTVSFSPRL